MTDREPFEAALRSAWEARDFDRWNAARLVYADWLEERYDALMPMARADVRCHPVMPPAGGKNRKMLPWMWRLYFRLPDSDVPPHGRWHRNKRVNRNQLLGFPPSTLRCQGFAEYPLPTGYWPNAACFTVVFKPRPLTKWVRQRGTANQGRWAEVGFDDWCHRCGFAALFWPPGWEPAGWDTPRQPDLFSEAGA